MVWDTCPRCGRQFRQVVMRRLRPSTTCPFCYLLEGVEVQFARTPNLEESR